MKATELRIGNFVFDDDTDKIMVVSKIETEEFTDWNSGEEFSITCLEFGTKKSYYDGVFRPIPLTEEILLKFGFEKAPLVYKYSKGYFTYDSKLKYFTYFTDIEDGGYENIIIPKERLKYVHQLQNLYFALIGEELILKN